MLNSFCKQNNHLGVEFAKVPTVCKVKILWQNAITLDLAGVGYPRCMLINMFWAKVLVVQEL